MTNTMKSKTNDQQLKLIVDDDEQKKSHEKFGRHSSVLDEFPTLESMMFHNKNAIKNHNKRKKYKYRKK